MKDYETDMLNTSMLYYTPVSLCWHVSTLGPTHVLGPPSHNPILGLVLKACAEITHFFSEGLSLRAGRDRSSDSQAVWDHKLVFNGPHQI